MILLHIPKLDKKPSKNNFLIFPSFPSLKGATCSFRKGFASVWLPISTFFFSKLSVQVSPTSPKVTASFGYTPKSLTWNLNMVASKFRISFSSGKISRAAMLDFRNWHADERPQASPKMPGLFDQLSPPQLPLPPTSPPMPDNLSVNSPPTKLPFFNLKMTDPKMKEVREKTHLPRNNLHDLVFKIQLFSPSTFCPQTSTIPWALNPPKRYLWISVWSNYSDLGPRLHFKR